jgi:creatinine amidohydrolase
MRLFAELNQSDLPASEGMVAILPLGAMESHGPHLPLGTDTMIAEAILDRASHSLQAMGREDVVLRLPALWLGASDEHGDRAGTLSQTAALLSDQITTIGLHLSRAGIDRLILLNAHGGNKAAAETAALRLRRKGSMLAIMPHWGQFGLPDGMNLPAPAKGDAHGGWQETSIMLALDPELVRKEKAKDFAGHAPAPSLFPNGPIGWGWLTSDINASGAIGRADLATAMLGNALLDHFGPALARLIIEVSEAAWPPA